MSVSQSAERKLVTSYVIGFVISLLITIVAFVITKMQSNAADNALPVWFIMIALVALASIQLIVQLFCFLHLGKETKPRLNTISFLFMIMVVSTIGFGSLWIMYNLDYNMMPRDVDSFVEQDENIHHH